MTIQKRVFMIVVAIITTVWCGTLFAQDNIQNVSAQLKKTFPQLQTGEIRKAPIDGLYEVEAGSNILYYYPKKDLMIFGEIWDKNGQSITQARRNELNIKIIKDLPLDNAIKIGNGKHKIIEFTDPDCPYCRKAADYFKDRTDVTRYVYLISLSNNNKVDSKVANILCSKDTVKSYKEAMAGRMDGKQLETCNDNSVLKRINENKELFIKAGLKGTPAFWVNSKFVSGANIPLIESIIGKKTN